VTQTPDVMAEEAKYFICYAALSRSGLQTGYPDQWVLGFPYPLEEYYRIVTEIGP